MYHFFCRLTYTSVFFLLSGLFAQDFQSDRPKVYHIMPHAIDQMEDIAYAGYLRKVMKQADEEQPALIILEINTPGGQLTETLKIERLLKKSPLHTVCFVNQNAISAGSLIALSCKKLVMSPGSRMGAATPVMMGNQGMKKAPEKILSASRAIWRSAAQTQNKNPDIAEAFVDENVVLTKKKHGIYKPKGKLLTLTTKEAKKLSMLDYIAKDINEIIKKEKIQDYRLITFQPTFQDQLIAFFLHPIVSGILIALGFLGILYELKSPGWGIPGALGITFLGIYFISRILVGQSGWGAPALFALGFLLLLLEFFIIPGFGITGILGFVSILVSILWSYGISDLNEGLWVLAGALVLLSLSVMLIFRQLPRMGEKSNRGLFLSQAIQVGTKSNPDKLKFLLGKKGIVKTNLRPSGAVLIDNKVYDAISLGEFIETEEKIEVISSEAYQVVVKRV